MTGKKAKEPRSLEEILKLSAKERARIVVNYSVNAEYNLPQEITEEDYRAITRSLYRSSREDLAHRRAEATEREIRELVYFNLAASQVALKQIEVIIRLKMQGEVRAYLGAVKEAIEKKVADITTSGAEKERELRRLMGFSTDKGIDSREAIEAFKPILDSLDQNIKNVALEPNLLEDNRAELQEAINTFHVTNKTARGVMTAERNKIGAYVLRLEENEKQLKAGLKKILPDKVEPQVTPEELQQFISGTLELIEHRSR